MKSKTKSTLTKEKIVQLVKLNFGEGIEIGEIKELEGGMFNSAYLIGFNNKDVVLKVSSSPEAKLLSYEKDLMRTEVEVYKLIEEQTKVPTPKVLSYDFSKSEIDSDYFFMSALNGETMKSIRKKLTIENLNIIKEELGDYFAQIHMIKGNYFGYFTENKKLQFNNWKDAFFHMVQMILNDGKKHKVKLPYDRINKALKSNEHYLGSIKVPSLVDYDLWAGNVFLIKKDGYYHVEGIVDFERAFWGDPYADFPTAIMILKDIQEEPVFWESYTKTAGIDKKLTKEDFVRITMYELYIGLIMSVETYRYDIAYGTFQRIYAKKIIMNCIRILENVARP
ncbi:aminoglycoside phosphotransferase family protein [Clostridium sp. YIM B02505]|uniref:Aminoglycoside phosphotransferase family protein n=1 Tax=Clostridium yunnanense TaxID=2800325 RepID=A0ABS1EKV2_9CLOT|nr:aminoglycoside phosphotransferase family protein [Clostridium yunnanense]MBK1809982.1 aminoglycoside phosphotransferase family protein [Clostridium yunnanense]